MRRREFISLLGGAVAVLPLTSHAQQMRIPRIGILLFTGPEHMGPFAAALRDLGMSKARRSRSNAFRGRQRRSPPRLVAELIASKVDIIVASLTPAVVAAKNARATFPSSWRRPATLSAWGWSQALRGRRKYYGDLGGWRGVGSQKP